MAVPAGQGDAAKSGERGGDIGGRRGLKVFARLNPITHEKHRDALVIGIRSAVRRGVSAARAGRGRVPGPVRFGNKEEVTAASREEAIRLRCSERTPGRGRILQFFGAINGEDTGNRLDGLAHGVKTGGIRLQFVVDARSKINVGGGDSRDDRLREMKRLQSHFDVRLHLGEVQPASFPCRR